MPDLALIVEDDDTLRQLLERTLAESGFECIHAANGFSGVKKALSYVPDLIVCDHHMPFANGIYVLKAARSDPHTQDVPFVLMSSDHRTDLWQQYEDEGANAHLHKPFGMKELVDCVQSLSADPGTADRA